jgi:hypothetical protein
MSAHHLSPPRSTGHAAAGVLVLIILLTLVGAWLDRDHPYPPGYSPTTTDVREGSPADI